MSSIEMLLRLYIFTPQTAEAAKRAVATAVGLFLAAAGAALVAGLAPLVALGLGLTAAAGAFGIRTSEGVYDSKRQSAGTTIPGDVSGKPVS